MLCAFHSAVTLFVFNHFHFLKWCACLHCLLHLDFWTFVQTPSLDLRHTFLYVLIYVALLKHIFNLTLHYSTFSAGNAFSSYHYNCKYSFASLFNSQMIVKLRYFKWTQAFPQSLRMTQKTWASASVNSQVQVKPPVQVPQKSKGSGMKENGLWTSLASCNCLEHAIYVPHKSLIKKWQLQAAN